MILVILAAGRGSRLKKKTYDVPKCMVKVKNKSIIEYNIKFIKKFKKVIIITGYKSYLIKNKFKKFKNIEFINNYKYGKTNMVYSFFCASKLIDKYKKNIVICYSDIIFDHNYFELLKKNYSYVIGNSNWLELWKKRMDFKKIKSDAESFEINKDILISIGQKITNKFPKLQFTGMIKFTYFDFMLAKKFFKKIKNNKIDFTNFINKIIISKLFKIRVIKTNKKWIEIDTLRDLKVAEKN